MHAGHYKYRLMVVSQQSQMQLRTSRTSVFGWYSCGEVNLHREVQLNHVKVYELANGAIKLKGPGHVFYHQIQLHCLHLPLPSGTTFCFLATGVIYRGHLRRFRVGRSCFSLFFLCSKCSLHTLECSLRGSSFLPMFAAHFLSNSLYLQVAVERMTGARHN